MFAHGRDQQGVQDVLGCLEAGDGFGEAAAFAAEAGDHARAEGGDQAEGTSRSPSSWTQCSAAPMVEGEAVAEVAMVGGLGDGELAGVAGGCLRLMLNGQTRSWPRPRYVSSRSRGQVLITSSVVSQARWAMPTP
ncbi:hypothetical protein Misp01_60040 [Microtetraspora sp. NBRC 13810]|nr:hypothetical protein Misp01_60040 [Microtetraspora sp. NBRC 13810]